MDANEAHLLHNGRVVAEELAFNINRIDLVGLINLSKLGGISWSAANTGNVGVKYRI